MAYTEASKRATQKYIRANLDEIRFRVKKGEKEKLKAEASKQGQSMAQYIIQAINDRAKVKLLTPTAQDTPEE